MAASDHLSPDQFFHGRIPMGSLRSSQSTNRAHVDELASTIPEQGVTPIAASYGGGSTVRVQNGNHRYRAAQQLKMPDIEGYVHSRWGQPPGMSDVHEISREVYEKELYDK